MKRTKILVMTAVIVLGLGSAVQAKLPKNSIMVGNNVYDAAYLNNSSHLADINDQLMNNLGVIYYVDSTGKAQDIFTGSPVDDSQIVSKVGGTLTFYTATGTKQKIVANANNEYTDPTNANTNMFAIVNVTYKTITTGLSMYTVKASVSGVSNASYFKVGDSQTTPLTDVATFMGNNLSGTGISFGVYASDGLTELAEGYINLNQGNSTSGTLNTSLILNPTPNSNPDDDTVHGNTGINITNNGFAAIDKTGSWIYYENTADGNKLYKKSVTGVEDYVISDDSVQYINVVGDWVYYSNYKDMGRIYKVRTDGTQRQKISDDMAACINVVGSKIYYINNSDRGRIYVYDSQGRRQLISDSAKYLSVGDNFIFYVNASDNNKLYSCNLLNNASKTKLSDINTEFISASNDYLVYYTGKDGKLYRSMGGSTYTSNPTPLSIVTNIPQKGNGTTNLKGVTDIATIVCGVDDNNIYYISNVDGKRIYKLDSTGNGYKVVNDSADYLNLVGDSLYYMKSGKASTISKDSDGTTKGTAITKPKLNDKVVSVEPGKSYSTDDISKFNFPDYVSATMSGGNQRRLVVNWDRANPKISKGSYTYTGTILGYGTKVTMTVSIDSGTIDVNNITVVNEVGSKDSVTVNGVNTKLNPGDVISVYTNISDTKPVKTAVVDSNYKAVVSGLNFDPNGTTIYVTVTAKDKAEGSKVGVPCPAEAPVGFAINAQDQKITGLKPGKSYKVYINDENADGTIPDLPTDYITDTATDKGEITVNNMHTKITGPLGTDNKKQMLRVVLAGNVDSKPSTPIEIGKAVVPGNISIDLNFGKIIGSAAGMQYRYNTDDWKDCQGGSTSISMTMSLQVQVKVKASGPLMESDPVTFGLFPVPQVTGIESGKIYSTRPVDPSDPNGKSTFPDVSWNTGTIGSITYSAKLTKKDGTVIDNNVTPSTLLSDLKLPSAGNGDYILTVTAKKHDSNMTPSDAYNSKAISFTINSSAPASVDISMVEKAGTVKDTVTNPDSVDTYCKATPSWTNLAGTYSSATIKMTKTAAGNPGSVTYTPVTNPATVAFVPGNTVEQNGEYELTVTTTSKENGAVSTTKQTFRVDSIDKALSPDVTGVFNGGTYKSAVTPTIVNKLNCTTVPSISLNGATTPYQTTDTTDPTTHLITQVGKELTVNGSYSLVLDTTNTINGDTNNTKISFTMLDTSSGSQAPVNISVTDNASGDDKVVVGNNTTEKIPYGSIIKVYSASGNLIGTATNNDVAGPVAVTITGGFPANDTVVYVTRTDSGKQESNKTSAALTLVPSIKSVSPATFIETSANDGTISGTNADGTPTDKVVVEIQNGKFADKVAADTDVNGNDSGYVTPTNLPVGLKYTVTKLDDTHLGITFSNKATSNDVKDSVDNLTFKINHTKLINADGITTATNDITTTPISIKFNGAPAAVLNIAAYDVGNNNNGSDLQVTFDKSTGETSNADTNQVQGYRVIVVKNSKPALDLAAANSITNYTNVSKTGSNLVVKLDASAKDSDGDAITNRDYKVYVLSIADGTNANLNSLSASVGVSLTSAPIVAPVAKVTAASTAGGDALVSAKEKTDGFNVVAQSNKGNSTLYVVPSVTASTASAITAASIGSAAVTAADTDTTIAITANNAKVTDGTAYVVYAVDLAGTVSAAVPAFTADLTAPTSTVPAGPTGPTNKATTLLVTFDSPLYIGGSAVGNGIDVKSSFTTSNVTIDSAIYNSTTHTISFTLSGVNDAATITHNGSLTDQAGNPYAAKVYSYTAAGTLWSSN
ncbi:DUF5050 domain-containing protein [Clostridium drakei]|uniref:DUF5050 domain-containing protein n=1 Tax=Clostridium drakei TaxID=332101 RepID=A0A2U8DLX3_9CLOT|nr:DUF5050 domain-containing protein [Clostridium drakei]AWI03699.1 hypothetical protein B9W14_04105 [Clostridium drakei]